MDFALFLKFLTKLLTVISWPSFTLVYPLYFSFRAIESKSDSKNQQCLTYWVLFSIIRILEWVLAGFLEWFQFWPYVKGILVVLLVIPCFPGASHVYQHVIRPYVYMDSLVCWFLFSPRKGETFNLNKKNDFSNAAESFVIKDRFEQSENVDIIHVISMSSTGPGDRDYPRPTGRMQAQKEWSCALCLVSTTNEKCLKKHLKGKKHKAKEAELRQSETTTLPLVNSPNGMDSLKNFNQISWINFEKWSSLLSPVTNSIRWCTWRKPEPGWTKLNTDGSIDRGNARFGGLLRDSNGDPICAYVSKVPIGDTFFVELWAVWRGLILATSLQIKVIWVESDSLSVVKTINRKQPHNLKASFYLRQIWKQLKNFEKYRVTHSWREANRAADYLSKMDLPGSDVVLQSVAFPSSLCNIIKDDAQGRRYRRV